MTSAAALLDEVAIRQLLARYNVLGDRGRVAEMVEVFAADGVLCALDRTAKGHDAIAAMLSANPTSPRHTLTRHHLTTQLIEVNGDSAEARSYFVVFTNIGADHHGVYIDKLQRIAGHWLIMRRDVRLDWQAPGSVYEPMPVHRRTAAADPAAPDRSASPSSGEFHA